MCAAGHSIVLWVWAVTRSGLWSREEDMMRLKKEIYQRRIRGEMAIPVVFYTGHGFANGNSSFSDSYADLAFLLNPREADEYDLGRP